MTLLGHYDNHDTTMTVMVTRVLLWVAMCFYGARGINDQCVWSVSSDVCKQQLNSAHSTVQCISITYGICHCVTLIYNIHVYIYLL